MCKLYLHSFFYLFLVKTHNALKIIHYSCLFALLAKIKVRKVCANFGKDSAKDSVKDLHNDHSKYLKILKNNCMSLSCHIRVSE